MYDYLTPSSDTCETMQPRTWLPLENPLVPWHPSHQIRGYRCGGGAIGDKEMTRPASETIHHNSTMPDFLVSGHNTANE